MARWRGRSRDWVERKYADYHLAKRRRQRRVRPKPDPYKGLRTDIPRPVTVESHRKAQASAARRASAKRGATKGAIYGAHALKGAVRLGSRALPVVGWGILAYDAYNLVKSLDQSDANQQHETPQPSQSYIGVNSSDSSTQFSEYHYPSMEGYQDEGPVHWSRTV